MISVLDRSGARKQTAVDSIHNRRRADLSPAEETAVQALDGVLSALNLVKLQVDIALGVGVDGNVNDVAVFVLCFLTNVIFKFLNPVFALLPVDC